MKEKGWMRKKEEDQADERTKAFKELEHWELKLRKARTEAQKRLAKSRIEYWEKLI